MPYRCGCGKIMKQFNEFLAHEASAHPPILPFQCVFCLHYTAIWLNVSFKTEKELYVHKEKYHPDRFDELLRVMKDYEKNGEQVPQSLLNYLKNEKKKQTKYVPGSRWPGDHFIPTILEEDEEDYCSCEDDDYDDDDCTIVGERKHEKCKSVFDEECVALMSYGGKVDVQQH